MSENNLKAAIIDLIRFHGGLAIRVNSGAIRRPGAVYYFAKWYVLGDDEQTAGVSDILAVLNGVAIAVETKLPGNQPTEAQRLFLEEWQERGGLAILAYSVEGFIKAVNYHFGKTVIQ